MENLSSLLLTPSQKYNNLIIIDEIGGRLYPCLKKHWQVSELALLK